MNLTYQSASGTDLTVSDFPVNYVQTIYNSTWLYNAINEPSGIVPFGVESSLLMDLWANQTTETVIPYWVEIGQVADQSFAGMPYIDNTVAGLYVGPGNYSTLLVAAGDDDAIRVKREAHGNFKISSFQFGALYTGDSVNASGWFKELGNMQKDLGTTDQANFELSFQGIGLSHYYHSQIISMMTQSPAFINRFTNKPDLSCDTEEPYLCRLAYPCKYYPWELSFRFIFQDEEGFDFYTYLPIAAFAIDNTSTNQCELYIKNLGTDAEAPVQLGSMFLQNF